MGDNAAQITKISREITTVVSEINRLEEEGDILMGQITNINNLVDDEGKSPTGVDTPALAEEHVDKLLDNIEAATKKYIELQKKQTLLITQLQRLASRILAENARSTRSARSVRNTRNTRSARSVRNTRSAKRGGKK
jgi:predicted  nucleic acid-binding Zn-ribbon protein